MSPSLEGKVTLITGAASGIGAATAEIFAERGARVVVSDIAEEGGRETVERIRSAGGEAMFRRCNVADPEQVQQLINATVGTYGHLDAAFNNAGVEGEAATTPNCSIENFDLNIDVNLRGVFLCMKYQIEQFLKQASSGVIVNTASVAGLVGAKGVPAYVAAKHGVVGLTKTAAIEFAKKKIRVNAVCPGGIRTQMLERLIDEKPWVEKQMLKLQPIGRLGDPKEVGRVVAFLCSDDASFVTGHAMPVDGGCVAI
ncbi:MAG: short chain dehydrogenase [Gammaproteobacteria bacterium]|nr:MAG: short chain dehydrogenase [Gammaproteobacteria bacterium]RLA54028.1 MAG: short chain dehydrogenase [Gammaproteobacteria bacterium]